MNIVIAGRTGNWSVHKPGCKDLKKFNQDDLWTVEVPDGTKDLAYEAARLTYEDHVSDYGWNETDNPAECRQYWQDCATDFTTKPCIKGAS